MRSVEFAQRHRVPLHVRSAFTWERGTTVSEQGDPSMEQAVVKAVTHDVSEAKMTVSGVPDQPGIAATLFRRLADADVNVDMIVQNVSDQGVTDISFTLPHADVDTAMPIVSDVASDIGAGGVSSDHEIGRVSLVGAGMKSHPGVAAQMFQTLADNGINIDMISTSAIRISCVVREAQVEDAVVLLHTTFGLDAP
jgi:aspartate kinase